MFVESGVWKDGCYGSVWCVVMVVIRVVMIGAREGNLTGSACFP